MSTPLSTVTLAVTFAPQSFPAATTLGSIVASLTGSASGNTTPVVQTVASGTASIVFSAVVADTYAISVQQQDGNGNALGAAITGSVVVTAPSTITLQVPVAVNASVSS